MNADDELRTLKTRGAGYAGLALAQGIGLCLLSAAAAESPTWPATVPVLFRPLALLCTFLPPLAMLALPRLPRRTALAWLAAAALATAAVGVHAATRGTVPHWPSESSVWPRPGVWFALGAALFAAQALAVPALRARRFRPAYAEVFETATRTLLQLGLTAAFVGAFWLVLFAGAALLKLVQIEFLEQLLQRRWFSYPAGTLAFAAGLLLLDARPALIAGVRSVLLGLFSWLLPVAALVVAIFLIGLPFVSLADLWKSRMSASLLLGMAAALAAFLNCACQDDEAPPRGVRGLAARVAAFEILPLVGLAAWGLSVRVGQYGWSAERVEGAATIGIAAVLGAGYLLAASARGSWSRRLAATNLAALAAFVVAMLALLTPVADPARLMVADQLARLQRGAVPPERFDYTALKFDGARWGRAALEGLAADAAAPAAARQGAQAALAQTQRFQSRPKLSGRDDFRRVVEILPDGRTAPDPLIDAILAAEINGGPTCPPRADRRHCQLIFVRFAADRPDSAVFYDGGRASVFDPVGGGDWRLLGKLVGGEYCDEVRRALAAGGFAPEPPVLPNLRVGERVLSVLPETPRRACE